MIEEFISSWPLFQESYLVGWLVLVLLSMVGVLVVARDQIFIGAAVSQASTLGIALAMWLPALHPFHDMEWMHSEAFLVISSVVFSVLAAIVTARAGGGGTSSHEAITGWVFLVAASLSVLLMTHSPHGMEEVHRLMSSGVYGATRGEVLLFAGLVVAVGTFLLLSRRKALLLLTDEDMASAIGMWTGAWKLGLSCLLGLTVGLSLKSVGMLYTFGCLILPSLAARNVCRHLFPMLFVGPLLGLGTAVVAFVLANHWDQPQGQMTVALLCLLVAVTAAWRRLRRGG